MNVIEEKDIPKYNCHKCNEKQLRNPLGLYYEQLIYALFRDNFCHTSVTLQSHFLTKIVDYHKQTYIHTNDKSVWDSGFKPFSYCGTIAQRESTSLTSKGSLVQSQLVPPFLSELNFIKNALSTYSIFTFIKKYIDYISNKIDFYYLKYYLRI